MSINLSKFGLGEMLQCSLKVRALARDEPSMEAAARRLCRFFYDELHTAEGKRACVLVRVYKVHPFAGLPNDLQRFARRALRSGGNDDAEPTPGMQCLTLLGTAGDEPPWNDRHLSSGHQAIPLPSPHIVNRAPMIAQLIRQFGLDLADVIAPRSDVVRNLEGKTYGVFHVEDAAGSPFIPAQAQFVERYQVRSVVGFGGSVTGGGLFAVILFTRTYVSPESADRFRTIALDVKSGFLPFADGRVFD